VLGLHIGSGSKMADVSPYAPPCGVHRADVHRRAVSLTEWLVSGNLSRFPNLKIVYSESQIGWMPFVLDRLDKVWEHSEYAASTRSF